MEKTFKQIITSLSGFCSEHLQIQGFDWGNASQLNTKDSQYPMVFLVPAVSTNDGHMYNMNFEMIVLDLLEEDLANKLDAMNDTLLIGNDVVANYWDNDEDYGYVLDEEGIIVSPFIGSHDAFTIGWVFDISLQIENRLNSCSTPKI